jgi:hypothetical protein
LAVKQHQARRSFHESIAIHSQTLRKVPHHPPQRARFYHLRKSKTQTETGITNYGKN